jgi:hypothetical protein
VAAASEQLEHARQELEEALVEQDIAQERFEATIGTSAEMGAYVRLRKATRRMATAGETLRALEAGEVARPAVERDEARLLGV